MQIKACRMCGGKLAKIFSLGNMPLVNYFPSKKEIEKEKKYPLTLCVCTNCGLFQLDYIVDPSYIFPQYYYFSGASSPLVMHLEDLARQTMRDLHLGKKAKILDIGTNDGSLLIPFQKKGMMVLGVEPGEKPAAVAKEKGIPVVQGFFTKKRAGDIVDRYGQFDCIFATHTLANIVDLHDFLEGVKLALSPKGSLILELGYVDAMLAKGQFDAIYHEHYSYFSKKTLSALLSMHGFTVSRMQKNGFHGGSIRVVATKTQNVKRKTQNTKKEIAVKEYVFFVKKVREFQKEFRTFFKKNKNKVIVGYGAPAKGVILLNYCGIWENNVSVIVDTTPAKQGKLFPGVHIPIVSEEYFQKNTPEYFLLLAWNYEKEIVPRLKKMFPKAKIIIPFPQWRVI